MPRKRSHVPAYRLHKPSGQARVIVSGEHIYLGRYGSPESREKYSRLIAKLAVTPASVRPTPDVRECISGVTVNEALLSYWRFAETYYSKDGKPTKELACMRDALRPVRRLYGGSSAADFGPIALKAVRESMVEQGLSRRVINQRVGRIKRVFKWAVAEELVPPAVHQALQAVTGLRHGRTEAREAEPVRPAEDKWVDAVLPYVSPQVVVMIRVQRLTGMRPCEVVVMRRIFLSGATDCRCVTRDCQRLLRSSGSFFLVYTLVFLQGRMRGSFTWAA